MHYTITDEHANDRRRLDSRLRVIVANDYQDSRLASVLSSSWKPWRSTFCHSTRYGSASEPHQGTASHHRPQLAERATQWGTGTMKDLLRGLLEGMNFQLGDKLLIVQINVGEFTELPRAVNHHMLLDLAPRACFKGACVHKAQTPPPWTATVNQIFLIQR